MHTSHSPDSLTSPERLVRRARAAGLDRVAVTDHGVFTGALAAFKLDPELVIKGEEMKCACGTHIIGLFLEEHIPDRLTVEDTAQRIREQGGVVYAPHPFAYVTRARDRAARALAVADVVEVFNARAFIPAWNKRASAAAGDRPCFVGSDSHFPWEIGHVYTEMPFFSDAASFLAAASSARLAKTGVANALVHACSITSEGLRTWFWLKR